MKYQRIIECAFQHCLSIEALSHEGATEAYNSIKNKAKEKGLKTVISTARHLYELYIYFKILKYQTNKLQLQSKKWLINSLQSAK